MPYEQEVSLLIKNFRVSLSHLQLYPSHSAIVQESIKSIYSTISELLKQQQSLTISETERHLLVDGKALHFVGADKIAAEALIASLLLHNLKSITFNQGVTAEELIILLEGVSKKKRLEGKNLTDILKEKGVEHIVLNERFFISVGEEEKAEAQSHPVQSAITPQKSDGVTLSAEDMKKINNIIEKSDQVLDTSKSVSAVDEAKELLKKENKELLTDENKKKFLQMLKQLDSMDHVDVAGEVVDKLSKNLEDSDTTVRLKSAQSFKEITPAVASLSDKKIIDRLEDKFISSEDKETNGTVYLELADLLEYGSNRLLNEGNYDKTIRIVGMFRRHSDSTGEGFLQRWQYAEKVLQKIANRHVVGILVSDLRDADDKIREQAYSVVMKLQKAAVPHLVDAIKSTEDLHLRKVIAIAIKNMGEGAIEELLNELNESSSPEVARRIIEALEGIGAEEILMKYLKIIFRHYDPSIRKLILKLLYQIKSNESLNLLVEAISDVDKSVCREAVVFLGKIKYKGAVESLLNKLNEDQKDKDDEEIQKETCNALGVIGDPRAIAKLIEIAKGPAFLSFKKGKSVSVRTASIAALSNFNTEEVEKILTELAKNKDKSISNVADSSLKRQKTLIDKKGEKLSQQIL